MLEVPCIQGHMGSSNWGKCWRVILRKYFYNEKMNYGNQLTFQKTTFMKPYRFFLKSS